MSTLNRALVSMILTTACTVCQVDFAVPVTLQANRLVRDHKLRRKATGHSKPIYVHACSYVTTYMSIHMCVYIYIYIQSNIYVHIHIHAHIFADMQAGEGFDRHHVTTRVQTLSWKLQ